MSFVSTFITKDFASIMSDGQVTASNKKSVQEDFKKIIKINNFLIGFTGNSTAPVELIKTTVKVAINNFGETFLSKELLLALVKECLTKYREHQIAKINIVLVGFSDGKPFIVTIQLDNKIIYEDNIEVKKDEYQLVTLCPFDYRLENGSERNNFLDQVKELDGKEITLDKITKMQSEMNDFVSDNSDTVNKRVFLEYIKNDYYHH